MHWVNKIIGKIDNLSSGLWKWAFLLEFGTVRKHVGNFDFRYPN